MRYSGITHITGEPDTGKTIFALQVTHPSKIAFFHDDVKLPPVQPGQFGLFVDLVKEGQGLKLLEYRKLVLSLVAQIKPGQFDAIIFDTWARFGNALKQYVIANPNEFREQNTYSKLGAAKGGEQWNEAHRYEAEVISQLSRLAPFVGLVTHLKDAYEGGAKTGQKRPDAGKSFDRVCNFRVWLRSNPASGVPIGIVLKRLNEAVVTDNGIEVVNILPWKLTPLPEEKSLWDTIDRYRQSPFGNRPASFDETPNSFEYSILTGIMTKEQREIWQANLKEKAMSEAELLVSQEEELTLKVKELSESGKGPMDIATELGLDVGEVVKRLG